MPKNFLVKSNNLSLHQIPCSLRLLCASHWLYRKFCCQSVWSFRRFQMDSGILLLREVCHHTVNRWDNGSTSVESGYRPCPYRRENPLKICERKCFTNDLKMDVHYVQTYLGYERGVFSKRSTLRFYQRFRVLVDDRKKKRMKKYALKNELVWSESNLRSVGCHALMITLRDAWKKGFREILYKVSLLNHYLLFPFAFSLLHPSVLVIANRSNSNVRHDPKGCRNSLTFPFPSLK